MDALPSPKPNRRKRLALRFAALVVAASALGAAYRFTRTPELVWWRSSSLMETDRRLKLLIPEGWKYDPALSQIADSYSLFEFYPLDRRTRLLKWIYPMNERPALLVVIVSSPSAPTATHLAGVSFAQKPFEAKRSLNLRGFYVEANYYRRNRREFNRTYRQICNSLTIE